MGGSLETADSPREMEGVEGLTKEEKRRITLRLAPQQGWMMRRSWEMHNRGLSYVYL